MVKLDLFFLEQLKLLHKKLIPDTFYSDQSYKDFLTKKLFKSYGIINLEKDLLAFIILTVNQSEADIICIGTKTEFQKKGFAVFLLSKCIEIYNLNSLFIEVSVLNKEAIAFYLKQDFNYISIRKNYYNSEIDAILMQKNII